MTLVFVLFQLPIKLDHRLQEAAVQVMTALLLWVLLSSCFMFDFKSFCCSDVEAVAHLQIQLELNFCLLCLTQLQRSLESLESFLKALFISAFYLYFVLRMRYFVLT